MIDIWDGATLVISLVSLYFASKAWNLSKDDALFQLRRAFVQNAEMSRSAWHGVCDDHAAYLLGVRKSIGIDPEIKLSYIQWLEEHGSFLAQCLSDACACADNAKQNAENYDAKQCRDNLLLLEQSIEKVNRLRGQMRSKYSRLFDVSI